MGTSTGEAATRIGDEAVAWLIRVDTGCHDS